MSAVKFLLENGADVNTKDKKNFTLLMYCAQFGDLTLISLVLSYGAKVNIKDLSGFTALDYAIQKNNLDAVRLLVENGADISDESYMLAMENNYKQIVKYFDTFDPNKQIFQKESIYR
ncbi:MAG: ankyrin repeat domain-containing protein [Arcobacteraceae bacterium]